MQGTSLHRFRSAQADIQIVIVVNKYNTLYSLLFVYRFYLDLCVYIGKDLMIYEEGTRQDDIVEWSDR